MPAKISEKIECLNPRTGRSMKIDAGTYELFSKTIYHTLKGKKGLSFTGIVDEIKKCFREKKIVFKGAVDWYAITVKNDMEARGTIEAFTEKGKKLNRLKK